jgi:flagellar basal-body rod protein FlgG
MRTIRRAFIGTMTVIGVAACIAAAILVVRHRRSVSLDEIEDLRASAWENLGDTFDTDLPTDPIDLPGVARVADPELGDRFPIRDLIDEELRDASPEEREIWRTELAMHSPEEIREILGLRRRLPPRAGDVEFVAGSVPEPKHLPDTETAAANRVPTDAPALADPQAPAEAHLAADAAGLIESAVEATHSAEQVLLNNIANANTIGFKRSRVLFGDMPYRQVALPGSTDQRGLPAPAGIALGAGVKLIATQIDVSQGRLRHTQEPLDLAIQGDGYFQIDDGNRVFYTRTGRFTINSNGQIVQLSKDRGRPLEPVITVPQDTTKVVVSPEGIVSVLQAGQSQLNQVGQLQLARFMSPPGLIPRGENLFEQSVGSGNPLVSVPGQEGLGELQQGYLEEANVVVADELAELRRMQEHLKTLRQLRADLGASGRAP